jgi:predicted dehydrogenase
MKPVTLIIIGAGDRGTTYAGFAKEHSDRARVVGVAEPREYYRRRLAEEHAVPPANIFSCWSQVPSRPRLADAAIVATPDALHAAPAIALARKGYQILLEKPMAPNPADCRRIVRAVLKAKVLMAVCHVMRYTAYTRQLKTILDSGAIGEIVCIQHMEPVGYWHQAHSFVRGKWRNQAESSFMLLAKSCHDLDWLRYVMDRPCLRASSFGSLVHFRMENKPADASDRCLDCSVEPTCPYSAKKIYLGFFGRGNRGWPVNVLCPEVSEANLTEALRTGPYGRCVYACDNDVVDNQVVNLEFQGGRTACFTMTAFNRAGHRRTRIFGTRGEIHGDGRYIERFDFLTDASEKIDTEAIDAGIMGGHGGGDYRVMDSFISAVAHNDPSQILSGPQETLESHLMVFAAEKSRRTGRVVKIR